MKCEWHSKKIGDVVDIRRGASPRPIHKFLTNIGMPWVKIADATSDSSRYLRKTNEYIVDDGINKSVIVEPETLIVSNSATPGLPKIMKITACVHDGWLVFSNYRGVTRDFLYYKFIDIRRKLLNQANGSVFQNLKTDIVKDFDIYIPSIQTQNKIVDILSRLDDKIELNNAINNNLEQQAQAIYQQMFIDNVRSDWAEGTLSDIADITMGQSPSGSSYNEDGNGTIFFQGRAEFGFRFPSVRLYTTEPKRMALSNDTLISVRAPVGDLNVAHTDCCIGRGLAAIHSKSNHQSFVLYTMFSLKKQLDVFNGEGTVFGSINRNSLNDMPIIIPSDDVLDGFEKIVAPMDLTIRNNYDENCRLQDIRDSLLPRLMSGELDVSNIEL